jgi:hypothetical protein
MANVGDALKVPGLNGVPHLHVIIWGPGQIPNEEAEEVYVLACFDSINEGQAHDPACVLTVGDHPFITHDTYVNYRMIRCAEGQHIDLMVNDGNWVADQPATRALLHKMRTGICESKLAKPKYQHALGC